MTVHYRCVNHNRAVPPSDAMALLDGVLPAGVNGVSRKNNANLTPTF